MTITGVLSRNIALKFDVSHSITLSEFVKNEKYLNETRILYDMFVLDDGYQYIGNLFRTLITHQIITNLNLHLEFAIYLTDNVVQLLEYSFIEEYGCTQETLDNLQAIIDKSNTLDIEAIDYLQILVCDLEAKIPFSLKSLNFVESIGEKLQGLTENINIEAITYSYQKIKNSNFDYMLFLLLISRGELFLVFKGGIDVIICCQSNLFRNIDKSSIVVNLTELLFEVVPSEYIEKLNTIKGEYPIDNDLDFILGEIKRQFKTLKNIRITAESKSIDLNSWSRLEGAFPEADIGFKRYKGQKKYVKLQTNIKLKE